jgi:hypothetical protein
MIEHISTLYLAVHWTARLSGLLFAAALAVPALFSVSACRRDELYLAFLLALTVHFGCVTWLATANGGSNMFPGGRSVAQVGGWPVVFGIFALFHAIVVVGFAARRAKSPVRRGLRWAGTFSRGFIGLAFVGTYLPLLAQSWWYALPGALVAGAVCVDAGAAQKGDPAVRR